MPRSTPVDYQQELPFALCDIAGRTTLTLEDIAKRLECTERHVRDLIEAQELPAISIGKGKLRLRYRVPVEAYRDFILRSLTCPFERSPLRHLPLQSTIRLHREITAYLKSKGVKP